MRYAGVVLMVVAMAPFSFGRAEDAPAREPDAVLRDVLRKAVAEVYADLDQNTFDWASTLAYSILEIDDKEQARVILLHNLENLEKNYQSREARVVGLREQPSFLHQDLMYRARSSRIRSVWEIWKEPAPPAIARFVSRKTLSPNCVRI